MFELHLTDNSWEQENQVSEESDPVWSQWS